MNSVRAARSVGPVRPVRPVGMVHGAPQPATTSVVLKRLRLATTGNL